MKIVIVLACAVVFAAANEDSSAEMTPLGCKGTDIKNYLVSKKIIDDDCQNFSETEALKAYKSWVEKQKAAGKNDNPECEDKIKPCSKVFSNVKKEDCPKACKAFVGCMFGVKEE